MTNYKFRFINEYAAYIKRRAKKTENPGTYTARVDRVLAYSRRGLIILSETMTELNKIDIDIYNAL